MEEILFVLTEYGLERVILALVVNLLTSLVKIPIKRFAKRLEDSSKLTRFIVFLPAILGFGVVFVYLRFIKMEFAFDKTFIVLWTTTSSLSLTFYAIIDKLFLSKKNTTNEQLKRAKEVIDKAQEVAIAIVENKDKKGAEEGAKIILKGNNGAKSTDK